MSKSGNTYVKVFYRIFPTEKPCWDLVKLKNKKTVYLRNLQQLHDPSKVKEPANFWEFDTDGIFFNERQESVYSEIIDDTLERVSKGHNFIITAFGQTGTGKSLTLTGLQLSEEDLGIAPRLIKNLLALKELQPKNIKMCIQMSYAEFSKTAVTDLLKPYPNNVDAWHTKENIRKVKLKSEYDTIKLLYLGEARKSLIQTNDYISHVNTSVLTFYVTTRDIDFSYPYNICSRIHLIDMAGTDTLGNISSILKNPTDVGCANLSKTNMELFFLCLMGKIPELIKVKQRISPLTYFLGGDLSNQSTIRFIGHVKILKENLPITMSMLRFGQLLRGYAPTQKDLDFEINADYKIKFLQSQLEELQKEKIQNSVLLNQDLTRSMNSDRMDHLERTVNEYLKSHISEIAVLSVSEASSVFKLLKEMCNRCEQDKLRLMKDAKPFAEPSVHRIRRASKATISSGSMKEKRGSLKKSSKRASVEKAEKSTSVQSLLDHKSKSQLKTSLDYSGSLTNVQKRMRSTGYSSRSMERSSRAASTANYHLKRSSGIGKRKSTNSMTGAMGGSERSVHESGPPLLPDVLPENQEAWAAYQSEHEYKRLLEEYRENEERMLEGYGEYLEELRKLQAIKEELESMKFEITEGRIMRKFNVCSENEESELTKAILTEAETICQENMERSQKLLMDQQETVLKSQAQLKIFLKIRKDLKKNLNMDFENYCKEKYNIPLPTLKTLSEEEMLKDIEYPVSPINDAEDKKIEDVKKGSRLGGLKKIMSKEKNRNDKMKMKTSITWNNTPSKT